LTQLLRTTWIRFILFLKFMPYLYRAE
jgi:hypothetical protein